MNKHTGDTINLNRRHLVIAGGLTQILLTACGGGGGGTAATPNPGTSPGSNGSSGATGSSSGTTGSSTGSNGSSTGSTGSSSGTGSSNTGAPNALTVQLSTTTPVALAGVTFTTNSASGAAPTATLTTTGTTKSIPIFSTSKAGSWRFIPPLLAQPRAGASTSGYDGTINISVGGQTATASLSVQDLPTLAELGVTLGVISNDYLSYLCQSIGRSLNASQFLRYSTTGNRSVLDAEIQALLAWLSEARTTRLQLTALATGSAKSATLGTPGAAPVILNASDMELYERVLAAFLQRTFIQNAKHVAIANYGAATIPPAWAIAFAPFKGFFAGANLDKSLGTFATAPSGGVSDSEFVNAIVQAEQSLTVFNGTASQATAIVGSLVQVGQGALNVGTSIWDMVSAQNSADFAAAAKDFRSGSQQLAFGVVDGLINIEGGDAVRGAWGAAKGVYNAYKDNQAAINAAVDTWWNGAAPSVTVPLTTSPPAANGSISVGPNSEMMCVADAAGISAVMLPNSIANAAGSVITTDDTAKIVGIVRPTQPLNSTTPITIYTITCGYSGNYSGFATAINDSGTASATISPSGAISITASSSTTGASGTGTGTLTFNGALNLVYGTGGTSGQFSGTVVSTGSGWLLSGVWSSSSNSGTFSLTQSNCT